MKTSAKKVISNKESKNKASTSSPLELILTILNFKKYSKNEKIAIVITLSILSIYPSLKIFDYLNEKFFIGAKIHDYFVKDPNKNIPIINIGIFPLVNDNSKNEESSIQELFINKFQNEYLKFYKYNLPLNPVDNKDDNELLKKYLKKYDILIWGNAIIRDGSRKYRLNYSTNRGNALINEKSLQDGEFDTICYKKLYSIIPNILLDKARKLDLENFDSYKNELFKGYFKLISDILKNDQIMKNISIDNKKNLILLESKLGLIIGKITSNNFYLEESLDYINMVIKDDENYEEEILLGKLQFQLAMNYFYRDKIAECNKYLNNTIKTYKPILKKQYKYIEHWEELINNFSGILPTNTEIKIDSVGKPYYYLKSNKSNNIGATFLLLTNQFERVYYDLGFCYGYLGKALYELGSLKNDSSLIYESELCIGNCINERLRKHYLKNFDYNKKAPPNDLDDILFYSLKFISDTSFISSCLRRLEYSFQNNINKNSKPFSWQNVIFKYSMSLYNYGINANSIDYLKKARYSISFLTNMNNNNEYIFDYYEYRKYLAEIDFVNSIMEKNEMLKNNLFKISILNYDTLINYTDKINSTYLYAESIYMKSLVLFLNSKTNKNLKNDIKNLKKYTKVNIDNYYEEKYDLFDEGINYKLSYINIKNRQFSGDGYATLMLADEILSFILYKDFGDKNSLIDLNNSYNQLNKFFSYDFNTYKRQIAFNFYSLANNNKINNDISSLNNNFKLNKISCIGFNKIILKELDDRFNSMYCDSAN